MTHTRRDFEVAGLRIAAAGVDDPHLSRDRYETIAGPADPTANLRLGLAHSPEPRIQIKARLRHRGQHDISGCFRILQSIMGLKLVANRRADILQPVTAL